ncbi:class I SAM-dependent methyltransferase [Chitinophaga agrisoli]|uniref:Class I SAM-dependent methyltransferase n=1 Tax=Chitinophaga agrisoli TaxID=2607653 RepID=A0A5B2W438_9BACT|nr:class I SAM-dependent methyltransferase [Chitinophaga agrisoli]KAA2245452.1 class I SAM-dependent methyltransferase [Chitinophaga agrisoli]
MFQRLITKSILNKIKDYRHLDGWLSDQEALGLYHIARQLPGNAVMVEIGSWQGKSAYCLCKGLRSGKVYSIDPFNADACMDEDNIATYRDKKGDRDLLAQFKQNLDRLHVLDKVVIKQGYSYQFPQEFDKIHGLFIDGDHSIEGCRQDFELYAPKLISGGFLAFHDYYAHRDELGPTYVIKNLVTPSAGFTFYGQYDSLWIARKR